MVFVGAPHAHNRCCTRARKVLHIWGVSSRYMYSSHNCSTLPHTAELHATQRDASGSHPRNASQRPGRPNGERATGM